MKIYPELTARQAWGELYKDYAVTGYGLLRAEMLRFRREAALERIVARQARTIEAQAAIIGVQERDLETLSNSLSSYIGWEA